MRQRLAVVLVCVMAAAGLAAEKPAAKSKAKAAAAASAVKPLRIAMYDGPGAGGANLKNLQRILQGQGHAFQRIKAADIEAGVLKKIDLVIFPGGSGSGEGNAIGESGREAVRQFIHSGGGYMGVCAGAYLGTCRYSWGLKVVNAQTVDSAHWKRGVGDVKVELTEAGRKALGERAGAFDIRYANGPLLGPGTMSELPGYEVLAEFRSELAENGAPTGVMVNTPAIISATVGKGRVILLSPHAEYKPETEWLIVNAANYATGRPATAKPVEASGQ